jgi:leucyl/phenylalanyl-tRNA---protein transferase
MKPEHSMVKITGT